METRNEQARWYSILALLAVNWLEPISDDDLFELYILVLTLDVLTDELGFGEPVEYGIVTKGRGHVAMFKDESRKVQVFFDQTPAAVLNLKTRYASVVGAHRGLSGGQRRPDIMLVADIDGRQLITLVEMKKSDHGRYLSDSVYKVFGYLFDFGESLAERLRAILVVPTGISVTATVPNPPIIVASGDNRAAVAQAIREALTV